MITASQTQGDASNPYAQIALVVTSGTLAATSINRALIEENLVEPDAAGGVKK